MIAVVTAVPARRPFVDYLAAHIPSLEIVWDRGLGAMDTFRRAWALYGDVPHLKLQDDVILCRGFIEKVEATINTYSQSPIQLFSRRKDDLSIGSRWLPGYSWMMNQAHYLPAGIGRGLADFAENWSGYIENPTADDILMADFFRHNRITYWNQCPNLVDHARVVSQINSRRSRSRTSLTFSDPELRFFPGVS